METWRGQVEERLEEHEAILSLVPELLERLGPETLSPEHQASVKAMAARLHELSGISYATIYGELNTAFHVGRHSNIPDAQWLEVATWFQRRIDVAEKRHNR
jgi:hypothetical protein